MTPNTIFPEIRWAQRSSATDATKNIIWLTVAVTGLTEHKAETTDTSFKFTGKDSTRDYAIEFEFCEEIDSKETKQVFTQQGLLLELRKKKLQEEYWPRLTKDTKRKPYIKTDFDKWVDEDEQNPAEENPMAGYPGAGGPPGAGGLPAGMDLASLLGGAGGAGGPGGFDMSKLGDLAGGDLPEELGELNAEETEELENDETKSKLGEAQE